MQAINQEFTDLNEQLRQATHIIGLPENWVTIENESERTNVIQHLARPRTEWLLRWILDKLKNETNLGKTARGNATAWKLLTWMILTLPVSRSAPHLRDAGFPSILERTLFETFDDVSSAQSTTVSEDVVMKDASDSSESDRGESHRSRKRKRGKSHTVSSNHGAPSSAPKNEIFYAVKSTLGLIVKMASTDNENTNPAQAEIMKMVLRTDSAQASRILRFWFTGIRQIIESTSPSTTNLRSLDDFFDLSLVLEIWELRDIDPQDEAGESSDDFSTECLVPILNLQDCLKSASRTRKTQSSQIAVDHSTRALDQLIAKHLFGPCRAAFLGDVTTEPTDSDSGRRDAKALIACLQPLRAKLLEAAEIEDAGDSIPATFVALFNAIPHLLDLTIRASPSRTPKGRLVEKPWIQATFQSLAECSGCPLSAPPAHVACQAAIKALEDTLRVLKLQNVITDSDLLKNLFWYHCIDNSSKERKKTMHWSLVAALMDLDSSIFVIEERLTSKKSHEKSKDITEFIFKQITTEEKYQIGFTGNKILNGTNSTDQHSSTDKRVRDKTGNTFILEQIIHPLMSTFVRHRNLLGFFHRWDQQLKKSYEQSIGENPRQKNENVWEDPSISRSLADLFEQSLTQYQIVDLIVKHTKRTVEASDFPVDKTSETSESDYLPICQKAFSSAVIISAILQSLKSDEIIQAVKSHLHSLFQAFTSWIQDSRMLFESRLAYSWFTLCQLLSKLWPLELHDSAKLQRKLLHPLMKQARKEVSRLGKHQNEKHAKSLSCAAAMLFLLEACDYLQTVSGSEEVIQKSVGEVLKGISSDMLEKKEHVRILECFCADFITLLACQDADTCRESLIVVLSKLSKLDDDTSDLICNALSVSITTRGSSTLRDAFSTALSEALGLDRDHDLHAQATKALLYSNPLAISRDQREKLLDLLIEHLNLEQSSTALLLSVMVHLQQVPNATAKISSDGTTLFNIAEQINHRRSENPIVLQLLRRLVESTLSHIMSNESQAQNKSFLQVFTNKVNEIVKAPNACSSARLSLLRAVHSTQKSTTLLDPAHYVELLKLCLSNDSSTGNKTASLYEVLDAFNELVASILESANILESTQTWLGMWVTENSDVQSYIASSGSSPVELAEYVARLHAMIAKFGLFTNRKRLINLAIRFLQEEISGSMRNTALQMSRESLASLTISDKFALVPGLMEVSDLKDKAASWSILKELITTLEDKTEDDASLRQEQLAILPKIVGLLAANTDYACFNILLNSINTILNDKPSLTTQYSIECVLSVLSTFTSKSSPALSTQHASEIFSRLCETTRLILLVHRGRLGGRFHLLLPLLQGLLFCLFIPNASQGNALPPWLRSMIATEPVRLTPTNANQYSRLLLTLCNPPQSTITKAHQHHSSRKSKDLNDPVRAAREKTSRFLYPLLASFCRFQLMGRLDQNMREKLMPGIWEAVSTASLHRDEIDAMFAGLSRSERDIWRGVWGDWEKLFGWKG